MFFILFGIDIFVDIIKIMKVLHKTSPHNGDELRSYKNPQNGVFFDFNGV
jgi:hypothetical protein